MSTAYLNVLCNIGEKIEVLDARIHSEPAHSLTVIGSSQFWACVMESGCHNDFASAQKYLVDTIYGWNRLAWARKFIDENGNNTSLGMIRMLTPKEAADRAVSSAIQDQVRPLVMALEHLTRTLRDLDPNKKTKPRGRKPTTRERRT